MADMADFCSVGVVWNVGLGKGRGGVGRVVEAERLGCGFKIDISMQTARSDAGPRSSRLSVYQSI